MRTIDVESLLIRRLRTEDIGNVVRLANEAKLEGWPAEDYKVELVRNDSIMLVGIAGGRIVGFILGRVHKAVEIDRGFAEIFNIGISPDGRRRRSGTRLLAAFVQESQARGAGRIWLEVRASNSAAIRFYQSSGFTIDGHRKRFYRQPDEDAVLMSMSIDGPDVT